jgi:hypothetical protein
MTALARIRVTWHGGAVVGPAVSTFYALGDQAPALQAEAGNYFNAIKPAFPGTVNWVIPSTGELIEDSTGELLDVWESGTPQLPVGGSGSSFSQGVGIRVVWLTNGVVGGRRVRGATFLCPIGGPNFSTDGTIVDGTLTSQAEAANDFVDSVEGGLQIWSRPAVARPGTSNKVIGAQIPDKVSWLRTRRT